MTHSQTQCLRVQVIWLSRSLDSLSMRVIGGASSFSRVSMICANAGSLTLVGYAPTVSRNAVLALYDEGLYDLDYYGLGEFGAGSLSLVGYEIGRAHV